MIAVMVIGFWVILAMQSSSKDVTAFSDVSHLYTPMMSQPLVWLTFLISTLGVAVGEILLRYK
jgi:hypothetical protein